MNEFANYTTATGDRWDLIAQYAYGDPFKMVLIMRANPSVPLDPVLPGGIRLLIPIQPPESNVIPATSLPPWKR